MRRLRFIRTAQAAGFTLEDIIGLLKLDAIEDRQQVREMAETRIAILDEDRALAESSGSFV